MEKEWHRIIAFNGSQERAFEEMVCQIAMEEKEAAFAHFERVGTPDGGVECYWERTDGTEWGWQAKYYESLGATEWSKIKASLFHAAGTHPALSKYYICIPHNLSDARNNRGSQKKTWERYKKEWTAQLAKQGAHVELQHWTSSVLFSRLSKPALKGTRLLFFKEIDISEEQMATDLHGAILSLGPRYSPALNLRIEGIGSAFDALSRNRRFEDEFKGRFDWLLIKLRSVVNTSRISQIKELSKELDKQFRIIAGQIEAIDLSPASTINAGGLSNALEQLAMTINKLLQKYRELEEQQKGKEDRASTSKIPGSSPIREKWELDHEKRNVVEFQVELSRLSEYVSGVQLKAANQGALLLRGNWGTGKSHLLADLALENKKMGIPVIFLLGINFPDGPPRNFIRQSLSPTHDLSEYLSALNALGKSKGQRILFIIDAINEGRAKYSWKDNVAALLNEFDQYPWIGLLLSYRTTYESILLPPGLDCPTITHNGFKGMEVKALRAFFAFYKIRATTPLLNPEFSNPLFLKLFCQTLYNLRLDSVPDGFDGISRIFEGFVDSVNHRIGERLGFPCSQVNLVQKAIDLLVEEQLKINHDTIPYERAHELVEPLLRQYSMQANFIEELLRENILLEDLHVEYTPDRVTSNGVSFSYERMIDHFKAAYLVSRWSKETIVSAFRSYGELYKLFYDQMGFHGLNRGLLNSMAILWPESFGLELYELLETPGGNDEMYVRYAVYQAELESILWRKASTTHDNLWRYFEQVIQADPPEFFPEFLNTILLVCANREIYFNADFLSALLEGMPLATRDKEWSIPLDIVYQQYENSSIARIIDWCWSEQIGEYRLADDSCLRLGTTLAWFFSSSNRAIRDKATKAFAALFTGKLRLLVQLVTDFQAVNDPYILERVIAGAYGACCRTDDPVGLKEVAGFIYSLYFRNGKPPVNLLTRDYAKAIVQLAVSRIVGLRINPLKVRPPFKSIYPTDIPDAKWVESLRREPPPGQTYTRRETGLQKLLFSLGAGGDFAHYIVGSHRRDGSFSAYRTESRLAYEKLLGALRGEKKKVFQTYVWLLEVFTPGSTTSKKIGREYDVQWPKDLVDTLGHGKQVAYKYLKTYLSPQEFKKLIRSEEYIKKGLAYRPSRDAPRFDNSQITRYILKRVFELGWSMELFGEYDSQTYYTSRSEAETERIGKKYQWIAFYEILALLTDHFDYFGRYSFAESTVRPYLGAWQEGLRNLDPGILLKPDIERKRIAGDPRIWWFSVSYSNWGEKRRKWLSRSDDMPDFTQLMAVIDPQTGEDWYVLNGRFTWEQEKPLGAEKYNSARRELWVYIKAFLVRKKDRAAILRQGSSGLFWGTNEQIPEPSDYYGVFNGELYAGDAYLSEVHGHREGYPFTKVRLKDRVFSFIETAEEMSVGDEYDASWGKYGLLRPMKYLFELLDARFGPHDACFYDRDGQVIGYDTAAYFNIPHACLLMRKSVLDKKLAEHGLGIIWHQFGEKEDIGENTSYVYRMKFSGFSGYEKDKLVSQRYVERE